MDKDELLSSQQRVLQISEVIALLRTDVQRRGGIVAWSKATGIHQTTVSKVLSGGQEPTKSIIQALKLQRMIVSDEDSRPIRASRTASLVFLSGDLSD
jgi:DNA-binding phage protein